MCKVIQFTGARAHRLHRCETECEGCQVCEGGLALCDVCGGAEASLPTHCPGVRMDQVAESLVQSGYADYRCGVWEYGPRRSSHG